MNDKYQYRILVVDDDEVLNSLFSEFLGSRGFETLSATSLESAKSLLCKNLQLDLILLDYQLGDGVGLDLLSDELVLQHSSMPPIIMISANEDPEFLETCFSQGVADYIIKPVNLSLLALKVKSLINSMRLQRIISEQNVTLEKFKIEAEREEAVAKFTFEYLVSHNSQVFKGIDYFLQSHSLFSGDISLARISPSGNVYFLLGDATGHGLSAAITIMPLVTVFNSKVDKGFHLQQIVTEINRKLVNDTPEDRFVAALVIELNFTKGEIAIWNGGMPTAYWADSGKILHRFPSRHMALGILDEITFDADITVIDMPANGILFMCSDGLIEQQNDNGKQFGVHNLESLLIEPVDKTVPRVLSALKQHVNGKIYTDDISICSLDPKSILADLLDRNLIHNESVLHKNINPFSWGIKVSGQKLAHADLPPMANHFLQYVGMDKKTCQKVFAIITEMVTNSIDHGILNLSSDIKHNPEGFMHYFLIREKLLKNLTDDDFIELNMHWIDLEGIKRLVITCHDSGKGYNYTQTRPVEKLQYSGRGIMLMQNLAERVEIFAPGNFIKAIL